MLSSLKKKLSFIFISLVFLPFFLSSQENDGEVVFFQDEIDSEESEEVKKSRAEEKTKKEADKEEIEKDERSIMEKYKPLIFIKDLLDDKLPLRIDFGAEPHRHGSLVFGAAYYDWTKKFSQSLRIEYDHYNTSTNLSGSLTNSEIRSYVFYPTPIVFYFGDSNIFAADPFIRVDIGAYINSTETISNSGSFFDFDSSYGEYEGAGLYTEERNDSNFSVGPAFGYSIKFPVHKYVSIISEARLIPAFMYIWNQNIKGCLQYNSSTSIKTSEDYSSRALCYPFVKFSLAVDFLRYLRVKAQVSYQHFNFTGITASTKEGINYSLHNISVRYGGELLVPSKTRKKDAHLWAGIYYEMTWNYLEMNNTAFDEYDGKWVLCFST